MQLNINAEEYKCVCHCGCFKQIYVLHCFSKMLIRHVSRSGLHIYSLHKYSASAMLLLLFDFKQNDIADAHGTFLAHRQIASCILGPLFPVDQVSWRYNCSA